MPLLNTIRSMFMGAAQAFYANPSPETFTHLWAVYAAITLAGCIALAFLLGLAKEKSAKRPIMRWWAKWGLGLPVMVIAHLVALIWREGRSYFRQQNAGNNRNARNGRRPPP